jgi:hypothetical protein
MLLSADLQRSVRRGRNPRQGSARGDPATGAGTCNREPLRKCNVSVWHVFRTYFGGRESVMLLATVSNLLIQRSK